MLKNKQNISILFVCMGNICRSPTAEGVFTKFLNQSSLKKKIKVDSAGTHAYHIGEPPDHRAISAAKERGVSLKMLRARLVVDDDFEKFDYIIAMDTTNLSFLKGKSSEIYHDKIQLFLNFTKRNLEEVPDPYYGDEDGFEHVLDLVEEASIGLLQEISTQKSN
ncbi:MAG: phosphotyrosine protein phosphatase [Gammaproteobacteria bacterium]|nr:phosphotyrosine protein phosphatase [Gammaproteobacteria bacterium]|tara:strand:+ start:287 stop:778 length:492 start_codon:yes stop_codon:yes gene_type:complete